MDEAINKGTELWDKIQAGNIHAFDVSDIIWLVGIVVVVFFALKVGFKFLKVIFVVLAIALMVGFLISSGVIPVDIPFLSDIFPKVTSTPLPM